MRIGIDCRTMLNPDGGGERAGVGHYTTHLVVALVKKYRRDQFVLFFDHRLPQTDMAAWLRAQKNVELVKFPYSEYKKYLPFGYSHVVVAQVLQRAKLDVFHAPAYVIPLQYRKPAVVTIHDLAIYKHPTWFPPKQQFSRSVLVPASVKKASRVIAVSKATAKMVQQQFSVPASRVAVVYEGFSKEGRVSQRQRQAVRTKFALGKSFLLFVGTMEPRKNLVNLVKAFDAYMDVHYPKSKDLQLVIAGSKGWKHEQIFRAIARAKWSSHIRVIGYITHQEKIALMQSCTVFVFPSLWEGFGLPVVEAASLGVPVLTSRVSSLPEVAGKGAVYVQPTSVLSITQGMTQLLRYPAKRRALGRAGKQHAAQFSWQRCAVETHAVYQAAIQTT